MAQVDEGNENLLVGKQFAPSPAADGALSALLGFLLGVPLFHERRQDGGQQLAEGGRFEAEEGADAVFGKALQISQVHGAIFGKSRTFLYFTEYLLLSEGTVTAERVCQEPFVVREEGSGTRAVVERAFAERGLALRPVMSLGNIEAIKRAVAAGVGIAMVSALTVGLEQEAGKLTVVSLSDLSVHRPLHRLHLMGKHQGRAVRAFTEMLGRMSCG